MLIPSWHSKNSDPYNYEFIHNVITLIKLGYSNQLDIRIMYEKDHIAESLNAFDIILPHIVSNNIEFSLLVDKTKNENTSELYDYSQEELDTFYMRVNSLNNSMYKKEYMFIYDDQTVEYKCFNDLFGKNEYSFKHYLCDAKRNNLYIHFDGNVYPCVDYFSHKKMPLFNIYHHATYKVYDKPILCQLLHCTCDWSITKRKVFNGK